MNLHAAESDGIDVVLAYHDRTKHYPERYARGPGGLDWANQPNPFRRFAGAPLVHLPLGSERVRLPSGVLFGANQVPPHPMGSATLGSFFELAMGLSARKEVGNSSWYLRMNPSSGNLHPTEAYAILPPMREIADCAAVYHYAPREQALEQRCVWPPSAFAESAGFWVALTSVTWREAWKYGERAFRYCQHDVGHALAALRFAAATLGWRVRIATGWTDAQLSHWLGLDREDDFIDAEPEIPELLLRISASEAPDEGSSLPPGEPTVWRGKANRLSPSEVHWSAIDKAVQASERVGPSEVGGIAPTDDPWSAPSPPQTTHSAEGLIRRRRSAVDFDGVTGMSKSAFLALLDTTLPRPSAPPFDVGGWAARMHLVLFVHRVEGLQPGLHVWLRNSTDATALRSACREDFEWAPMTESSSTQPLYRLAAGEVRDFARAVSCWQDIAADSAFSLGMLARFESVLRERGASAYRELFWEAGMIGQALYLAAEAAGLRGTGIGCYFDDVMHDALGLRGSEWQSLYHFTIGCPVEDPRLRTLPPYAGRAERPGPAESAKAV